MAETKSVVNEWDYRREHVIALTDEKELNGDDFISAETMLIAAGPARISGDTSSAGGVSVDIASGSGGVFSKVLPIAGLESAAVRQQNQLQRLFEIGSKRSYFIPGRNLGSITLDHVLYYGKNLLRLMYDSTYKGADGPGAGGWEDDPGETENFWINLSSQVFDRPIGLAFYMINQDYTPYGAFYCEECYIDNHSMGVRAGAIIVTESVTVQFDRIVPIQMTETTALNVSVG